MTQVETAALSFISLSDGELATTSVVTPGSAFGLVRLFQWQMNINLAHRIMRNNKFKFTYDISNCLYKKEQSFGGEYTIEQMNKMLWKLWYTRALGPDDQNTNHLL